MAPLNGLNKKLLQAAIKAGLASEGQTPVDDDKDNEAEDIEDEEEETPPASKKKAGKSKSKAKAEGDDEDDTEAEGDDEDVDAEDEDVDAEDGDEDDSEAEGDDEDVDAEDEEEEEPVSKKKASGEKGRIQAILESPLAAGREKLAKHLAFDTSMSAKAAIGVLKNSPAAKKAASLRSRMAAVGNPNVKQGPGKGDATEADLVKGAVATAKSFGF